MNHDVIYNLYPNVVMVDDGQGAFDKDGNKVVIDKVAVAAKTIELEAEEIAKQQAAAAAKQSALNKLAAIGLTPDEIKSLLGV
jgi:hypothetical protein